jgi:hypothetical protein
MSLPVHAETLLKQVYVWWYQDDVLQENFDVYPGDEITINRDSGSPVEIRIFKTDSAPTSVTYSCNDIDNGISKTSSDNGFGFASFTDCVGPSDTQVWASVETTEGLVKINVNNIVPQDPDPVVTNVTVENSTLPESYQVGQTVDIDAIVRNQGDGTAGSSQLGYYIGTSGMYCSRTYRFRRSIG